MKLILVNSLVLHNFGKSIMKLENFKVEVVRLASWELLSTSMNNKEGHMASI